MEEWAVICLLLCGYGVLKEHRPSEPFITKYLSNPPMNFTHEEINTDIYPVAIYATMPLLVLIFLITDMLRYKPIIILNSLAGTVIYIMLIVCRTLFAIQVVEVLYGVFMACEVSYYTYIYAKVDTAHYQEVTGYTRAAYLIGRAISGITAQILVSTGFSYYTLNFFTLGGMILSLIWALFLPSVSKSIYFNSSSNENIREDISCTTYITRGLSRLKKDFVAAFTNFYVIKWSFWWAIATAGYLQVLSYNQLLWEEIIKNEKDKFSSNLNGAVEAAYTILGALAASGCGKLSIDWSSHGEFALFACSAIIAAILYIMSRTTSIWVAYFTYIAYTIFYHGMITIANSEVAKTVNKDSHGLIFGFNTFLATAFQSLITFILINQMNLDIRTQFVAYGLYFLILGIIFFLKVMYNRIIKKIN